MNWDRIRRKFRTMPIGSVLLTIFCIILIVVPFVILANYFKSVLDAQAQAQELKNQIWREEWDDAHNETDWTYLPPDQPIPEDWDYNGFQELYDQNRDFVGWLTIDDTVIDYPVMQTRSDENYYLHRDFYGNYSSSGTLFMNAASDARIPTTNIIIHGHHMQAGNMFGNLQSYYKNYDAYKEHQFIRFDTIWGNGLYEVVGAYFTTGDDMIYDCIWIRNEEEFNEIYSHIMSNSVFDADADLEYGDTFITLSTCAYHTDNGRFVVIAKKINPVATPTPVPSGN